MVPWYTSRGGRCHVNNHGNYHQGNIYPYHQQQLIYLFKCTLAVQNGEILPDLVSYLRTDLSAKSCMTSDVALGCLTYQHRAARLTNVATATVQRHINEGRSITDAFNMVSTELTWAANAHCHQYVVKVFISTVGGAQIDDRTKAAITTLCKLYAVNGIMDRFFNADQVYILTKKLMTLLADVRPDAVALVDAFHFHDKILDSCLGRYDGNVYHSLYEYAKTSPLNEKDLGLKSIQHISVLRTSTDMEDETDKAGKEKDPTFVEKLWDPEDLS
ncbi:Peroxisomal acyl-coenzyme A oxidase 1 [Mizuhopecten yessoensis]|uniref:Peroxisomal acyl-coenzyme A oxidase 1 n=1 Tax=Mizuhopecten yessoensis TaxID=6573 RepID=A0A210QKM9_MIZYE|nr:Peroxisomal acyl-coenzyme A oxidase 1 [Mizuhopecten yessoensis]